MYVHKKHRALLSLILIMAFFIISPSAYAAEAVQATDIEASLAEVNLKEDILSVTKSSFVSDTFNGVDALYRPGRNDGSNSTYSCAAFVKKYYKTVYDVTVNNLYGGSIPNAVNRDSFIRADKPQVGDIVAEPSHWAIVKAVNEDDTVILIEQNWKWQQGGKTVTKINRIVKNKNVVFYRLKSENVQMAKSPVTEKTDMILITAK